MTNARRADRASVYRRRRIVALVAGLFVVGLAISVAVSCGARRAVTDRSALAASSSAPSAAPSPVPSASAPLPRPCSDAELTLTAELGQPSYVVGQQPALRLVLANTGTVACSRDLDAGLQEIVVAAAAGTRVWSSNDCSPTRSPNVRSLEPASRIAFTVTWSGRASQAGCPPARGLVPAGDYQVQARFGALVSAPVVLRMLAPVRR